MIEILSTQVYSDIPTAIMTLLIAMITVFICAGIIFAILAYTASKDEDFKGFIYFMVCVCLLFVIAVKIVHYAQTKFAYQEYIAIIHDDALYNEVTNKYIVTPNNDGTVTLRPIEKEKVEIK